MPRIKPKRTTPRMDMTPLVDLAFLLVTFFMLTTKFRAQEPVTVNLPSSTSELTVPPKNIILLTVSQDGRVFFDLQNQGYRKDLLTRMGKDYNIAFTADEAATFSNLGSFGIPIGEMKQFLDMPTESRDKLAQTGIPDDSANNQLLKWVLNARLIDRSMPLAIKGDKGTHYDKIKNVIQTIQGQPKVNNFSLITSLEANTMNPKKH